MTHIGAPHMVDALGLIAGAIGVSTAIWLQLVTRRRCPPRYVVSFLILGTSLIMLNLEPVWPTADNGIYYSRIAAYVMLIVGQVALGIHVWRESPVEMPHETMSRIWHGNGNGGK